MQEVCTKEQRASLDGLMWRQSCQTALCNCCTGDRDCKGPLLTAPNHQVGPAHASDTNTSHQREPGLDAARETSYRFYAQGICMSLSCGRLEMQMIDNRTMHHLERTDIDELANLYALCVHQSLFSSTCNGSGPCLRHHPHIHAKQSLFSRRRL